MTPLSIRVIPPSMSTHLRPSTCTPFTTPSPLPPVPPLHHCPHYHPSATAPFTTLHLYPHYRPSTSTIITAPPHRSLYHPSTPAPRTAPLPPPPVPPLHPHPPYHPSTPTPRTAPPPPPPVPQYVCKCYYWIQSMSYTTSVIILTVISCERYMAIMYPMKRLRQRGRGARLLNI